MCLVESVMYLNLSTAHVICLVNIVCFQFSIQHKGMCDMLISYSKCLKVFVLCKELYLNSDFCDNFAYCYKWLILNF